MQQWYLGWEMVYCLERCPQFKGVLIGRVPLYILTYFSCMGLSVSYNVQHLFCRRVWVGWHQLDRSMVLCMWLRSTLPGRGRLWSD